MDVVIERKQGEVIFTYYYKGGAFSHTIYYPKSLNPSDDSLFKIAFFSRPKASEYYEIEGVQVNRSTKENIERYYNVSINISISSQPAYQDKFLDSVPEETYLCFSGGFDSVTSKALLEDAVNLISIDFGGAYERESHFFNNFDTNIIKWELRGERSGQSVRFNEALDWHWMLSPALLFQEENKPFAIATGTILESAGPWWFSGLKHPEFKHYESCGFGSNIALINPVACLTEFATTLVANQYLNAKELQSSLKSLAMPKSLKAFRKKVLLSIIQGVSVPDAPIEMSKHYFGSGFTDDFMTLYFSWKFGKEWVLSNYADRLPEEAENIDMSFAEKIHQQNLDYCDNELKSRLTSKLKKFGMEMYSTHDYIEIEKVKTIINS